MIKLADGKGGPVAFYVTFEGINICMSHYLQGQKQIKYFIHLYVFCIGEVRAKGKPQACGFVYVAVHYKMKKSGFHRCLLYVNVGNITQHGFFVRSKHGTT